MNGRLYDPLLRRFLNADENIQDPTNTQNYNKYGYVLNNPLMFNDPSGEIGFVAGFFLTYIVPIIWAAIVGTAISVGIYAVQATINNNWSWNGFGRSLLMGAVTGAVSGGLGQIFTAGTFWATVGNGALTGAGSGGAVSLINGDNFLKGVVTGAVIGGAVAATSYTISVYRRTGFKFKQELKVGDIDASGPEINPSDPYYEKDPVDRIKDARSNHGIGNYGVGKESINYDSYDTYGLINGRIEKGKVVGDLAVSRFNFFKNTTSIEYSYTVVQNKYLLAKTMAHETAHAYYNASNLIFHAKFRNPTSTLNNLEHLAIKDSEWTLVRLNNMPTKGLNLINQTKLLNRIFSLSPQGFEAYQKLIEFFEPIFNRKLSY